MPDGWEPVSYRQDNLGMYQEAVSAVERKLLIRPKLVEDLKAFAFEWDQNIAEQGFAQRSPDVSAQSDAPAT